MTAYFSSISTNFAYLHCRQNTSIVQLLQSKMSWSDQQCLWLVSIHATLSPNSQCLRKIRIMIRTITMNHSMMLMMRMITMMDDDVGLLRKILLFLWILWICKNLTLIVVHQTTTKISKWDTSTWKKWTKRKHCQHGSDKYVCVTWRLLFQFFLSNNRKVDFWRGWNA